MNDISMADLNGYEYKGNPQRVPAKRKIIPLQESMPLLLLVSITLYPPLTEPVLLFYAPATILQQKGVQFSLGALFKLILIQIGMDNSFSI